MNYILFDDNTRHQLLPFTHTRPTADIRCGIFTMRERWEKFLKLGTSTLTESYLQPLYPIHVTDDNCFVNAAVFATRELAKAVANLKEGHRLVAGKVVIAARFSNAEVHFHNLETHMVNLKDDLFDEEVFSLEHPWDIFSQNERAVKEDFKTITKKHKSESVPGSVSVAGKDQVFIEDGAIIHPGVIINAHIGPVYIGKDAEIMEGALLRGPIAVCEHAVVKMGAKIYGGTTIGPGCKVGGEVSNVVFFANSNKGHDGFLGNSVIGEWCNLGADTNCSNLKNNYDEVKIWDEHNNKSIRTGLTFCGLLMGDHSKSGINTMFNTGTVVGVSANIFGAGFPAKFVPSFCWGGGDGMVSYDFNRAMETARRMMSRRSRELSVAELAMYHHLFDATAPQRDIFAQDKN